MDNFSFGAESSNSKDSMANLNPRGGVGGGRRNSSAAKDRDPDQEGKLSDLLMESRTIARKAQSNTFGRRDSLASVMSTRRTVNKIKLNSLTPEDIIRARKVFETSSQQPLFTVFHVTSLLAAFGLNTMPSTREIEKCMMKTAFSQQQQSGHGFISSGGGGEEQLSGSYLSFDTFLEILELLRRAHIRQVGKEDECFEAFEALNYRFRTASPSMHRTGSLMTDENSSTVAGGSGGAVKGSRVSIPLKQVEEIVKAVGVEYDFHSLLAAVDSNFDGNVTPTQFRWCAGTEDPTIVAAFVALGGEETLSGTIPVDVLISRCTAMGMTAQYIANFVSEIDVNNDGVVDFSEFLAMIVRHKESKELKRTWSTGAKVFQPGGSQRIDSLAVELLPGSGGGASGQPTITATGANGVGVGIEGFNPFPRRNNFRRMSHQDGPNAHRPSFPLQPDPTNSNPSPHSTPLNPYGFQNHPPIQTFGLNEGINLDEETNVSEDFEPGSGNEFGRSSEDGDGSESNSSDSDAAFADSHDGTFSILGATTADRSAAAKHPKSTSKKRKTAGGGFSIDIQGLIHRKSKSKADEKSWTDRIAEVTAKGRNNIAAHRQKVAKYMSTTAVLPVKKIATERDGLVDVSTEKGRNQIKYYFGVKKRLPSKNVKVNPRLTAPPRRYVDELLEEAKRTHEAQEEKAKAKQQIHSAPRSAAAATLAAAAAVLMAYTGFCNKASEEGWDSLPPDVLLEQMLLGANRFSRKPSTAKARMGAKRDHSPSVSFTAGPPSSRPTSARRPPKPPTDSTAVVAPRKPISNDVSPYTQYPASSKHHTRRMLGGNQGASLRQSAPPQNRVQRRLSEQLDLRAVLEEAAESWNGETAPPQPRPRPPATASGAGFKAKPSSGRRIDQLGKGKTPATTKLIQAEEDRPSSSNPSHSNPLRHIFLNNPRLEKPTLDVVDMSEGI